VDRAGAVQWEASELLEKWQKQRRRLTAPALFAYEATNALAKRVKRGQLTLEAAKERLASLLENGPALESDVALNLRALEIMERFSLPSAYDAHYLALAESRQCECWTADERIWNTVKRELAWVRWVGQRATADIG
jgi:predicted nucleic acid-binding protein